MAKNTKTVARPPTPDIQKDMGDKAKAAADKAAKARQEFMEGVKSAFLESQERDIQLSDKVLSDILDKAANQWDEWDDEQQIEFLLKAEETAKVVMVVDPGIVALVNKMDDAFHKEVSAILAAKVKDKTSSVDMLAQMYRIYTMAEMNGMAMPGTEPSTGETVKDFRDRTGYLPDKVKTETPQGEPLTKVWTRDFADAWPEVKAARKDLEDLEKENTTPGSTRFKAEDKESMAAIKQSANQTINGVLTTMRRAIKLHHRLVAIRKLNQIGIRFIAGTKTKGILMPTKLGMKDIDKCAPELVTTSGKPLWMFNVSESSKGRDFSVTQILAMKPENARLGANGGNMADLIDTAGKGSDDTNNNNNGTGENMDPDEAQATANLFFHWIAKTGNRTTLLKTMADYKKNASGTDWIETIQELDKLIHPIAEKTRNLHSNIQNAKLLNADNEAEDNQEAEAA